MQSPLQISIGTIGVQWSERRTYHGDMVQRALLEWTQLMKRAKISSMLPPSDWPTPAGTVHMSSFCSAAACQLCPNCQHTGVFDPTALSLSLHAEHISRGSHTCGVSVNELCDFFVAAFGSRGPDPRTGHCGVCFVP